MSRTFYSLLITLVNVITRVMEPFLSLYESLNLLNLAIAIKLWPRTRSLESFILHLIGELYNTC